MLDIKILGPGCANCKRVEMLVRKVVVTQGLEAEVEKVTDFQEISKYPILSTPGLVLNGKVLSSGRIPTEAEVAEWLTA